VSWVCAALVGLSVSACASRDTQLRQHQEKLESLGSSTITIAEAWLSGSVSGTYAVTALDQTFVLVEQERSALAAEPDALVDPRGAALSDAAERLSRLIAVMRHDVQAADGRSVRQHLAEVPIAPHKPETGEQPEKPERRHG
jgi:hypothetical protein